VDTTSQLDHEEPNANSGIDLFRQDARLIGRKCDLKIRPNISDFAERAPTPTEPHQSAGRDGRGVAPHDPHFQWYEMGEPPAGEATYVFASSVSSLRYINEHANPAGVHYHLVLVSVVDLRTYSEPPRSSDLLANFERLEEWFLGKGGQPVRRG
jgi:hypothetical protein